MKSENSEFFNFENPVEPSFRDFSTNVGPHGLGYTNSGSRIRRLLWESLLD